MLDALAIAFSIAFEDALAPKFRRPQRPYRLDDHGHVALSWIGFFRLVTELIFLVVRRRPESLAFRSLVETVLPDPHYVHCHSAARYVMTQALVGTDSDTRRRYPLQPRQGACRCSALGPCHHCVKYLLWSPHRKKIIGDHLVGIESPPHIEISGRT